MTDDAVQARLDEINTSAEEAGARALRDWMTTVQQLEVVGRAVTAVYQEEVRTLLAQVAAKDGQLQKDAVRIAIAEGRLETALARVAELERQLEAALKAHGTEARLSDEAEEELDTARQQLAAAQERIERGVRVVEGEAPAVNPWPESDEEVAAQRAQRAVDKPPTPEPGGPVGGHGGESREIATTQHSPSRAQSQAESENSPTASCSPACPVREAAQRLSDNVQIRRLRGPDLVALREVLAAPSGPQCPELPEDQEWACECLAMIREDLEAYGMDMTGCPPMMYNDALRSLVARLGKYAWLTTTEQVREIVQAAPQREMGE